MYTHRDSSGNLIEDIINNDSPQGSIVDLLKTNTSSSADDASQKAASSSVASTPSVTDKLINQILGQNLTSKWSGEGFGSAQANAADMAKILSGIGITDIKDFGQITKTIPAHDEFVGDEGGGTYVNVPEQKVTTYGNIKTGQEVPNTYSERQTGNAWGGTFAGKGNTGYRVQFAPDGTPIFYTTGASSNDLVNLFADDPLLGAIAQAGAAYFGGPWGTAALNAAMGKDLGDIAKATALSYLGNQVAQGVTGMEGVADTFGDVGSKVIGKAAGQVVASGGQVDPVQALLSGGIGAGTDAVLSQIPDFKTLDPTIQKLVAKSVSSTLAGGQGLTAQDLVNTAFKTALDTMKSGGALTDEEKAQILQNREATRLAKIEDAVLNQTASDDGSTQGILDLINQMYPAAEVKGMSEADLAKFLEANINDIQGSADLETLLKSVGKTTADEGTVTVTGNREGDLNYSPTTTTNTKGAVTKPDNPDELVITDKRDDSYVPSIRTKDIKSDIPDEITPDQIDTLFPNININDILQTVTPVTKTPIPVTKTTTPTTPTTEQSLANLGLNAPMSSQDPYANIKLMEDLFGGDTSYKLRALGAPRNLASADLDALTRLLRG